MYGATGDNQLTALRETPYEKELDLQDFLTRHPALLAGDQMNAVDPRRFMLVSAEAGIAIVEGGAAYFSLDHLFLDQDGIPTLVEVKRSLDFRARREVIGQMLEYAANACAHWNISRLRSVFEARCLKAGISSNDELQTLQLEPNLDADGFWDKVAANLEQEKLRLVFVADKFSPETQRIIEFLNGQMQKTEVYAVEMRQFIGVGMRTLAPRVLNPSILQTDRRATASGSRGEIWTEDRFYVALAEHAGEDAVSAFRRIQEWAADQAHVETFFGRGKGEGSIIIGYQPAGASAKESTVFLTLWTSGRAEVDFEYLKYHHTFEGEAAREDLRRRIVTDSTIVIDGTRIGKRPSIPWATLQDRKNMDALLNALQWVLAQLELGH
jgi:hypothetical protein